MKHFHLLISLSVARIIIATDSSKNGENTSTESPSAEPFDITDSLGRNFGAILYKCYSYTNKVPFLELTLENTRINLSLIENETHYIKFEDITLRQFTTPDLQDNLKAITCDFFDFLSVRIPIEKNNVQFGGYFFIFENKNSPAPLSERNYSIVFEYIRFELIIPGNSIFDPHVDISIENIRTDIQVSNSFKIFLTQAIDKQKHILKKILKSIIHQKAINHVKNQSFALLIDTCINPKTEMNFVTTNDQHYYITLHSTSSVKNTVKIKDLTNINTMMTSGVTVPRTNNIFTFIIQNVQFETFWTNTTTSTFDNQLLEFQCDNIFITGSVMFDDKNIFGVPKVRIQFSTSIAKKKDTNDWDKLQKYIGQLLGQYMETGYKYYTMKHLARSIEYKEFFNEY